MKTFHNFPFFILCLTFFSTANTSADTTNPENQHEYKVGLNNPELQSGAASNIQHHVNEKYSSDDELKIILFDQGRALSLDATTLNNTKIVYGNNEQKTQEQMTDATNQETHSTICQSSTNSYRHYSTKESGTTADTEVQQPQGDNCNH